MDPDVLEVRVIVVDSSAVLAALVPSDPNNARAKAAVLLPTERYVVPLAILSELAYMVEARVGARELDAVLAAFERGEQLVDCGDRDLPRIRHLVGRYIDLPLGVADAAVVALRIRGSPFGRAVQGAGHDVEMDGQGPSSLVALVRLSGLTPAGA